MRRETLPTGPYTRELQARRAGRPDFGLITAVRGTVLPSKTVVDLGCGRGFLVRMLRRRRYGRYRIDGVDGTPGIAEVTNGLVSELDLTGDCEAYRGRWDWGVCTEVGEHIPPELEGKLLDNLCLMLKEGLLMTWAPVGSRGYGHVNCRTVVYVASEFARRGWYTSDEKTLVAKQLIRHKYRERLLVVCKGG